jgi:probable HAF family extracellular repeat protein
MREVSAVAMAASRAMMQVDGEGIARERTGGRMERARGRSFGGLRMALGTGAVALAATSVEALGQGFFGLGYLPGGWQSAGNAVSEDGFIVVGVSRTKYGLRAIRWTPSDGLEDLGTIPGGHSSEAHALSADGSVIVGVSHTEGSRAFRWTRAGGMEELPGVAENRQSGAFGISDDAALIVGHASTPTAQLASTWDSAGVVVSLGTLPGMMFSMAKGVSADGSVVVGHSWSSVDRAFRWTHEGGMEDLGSLPGAINTVAKGVSADGSTIVGYYVNGTNDELRGFRWTREEGMRDLGILPGWDGLDATATNADGSVVVGSVYKLDIGQRAVRWDAVNGVVDLQDYLEGFGFDFTGRTLLDARDISADGLVITGLSSVSDGLEGWVVNLRCARADFNHDANVNSQDFFDFLAEFFVGDPGADFNLDGVLDSADFFAYLDMFFVCA